MRNKSNNPNNNNTSIKRDLFNRQACLKASILLKEERLKQNLSRYYLSTKTKISINVIEALENGWINKFPEKTYLYKMLRILEKELDLDSNALNDLLPRESKKRRRRFRSASFLDANKIYSNTFSLIIYIACMLTSILLLNGYHLSLSKSNVLTVSPIFVDSAGDINENIQQGINSNLD